MNTRSLLFSLLLVALSGAQAQSLPAGVDSLSVRPLNLTLRPAKVPTDAVLVIQGQVAMQLPYGAGFESRQLGNLSGSPAGGQGQSGRSGGGRGGSGRGR